MNLEEAPDCAMLLSARQVAISALAGPAAAVWLYGRLDGDRRWRTALHEAAHVVVGMAMECPITSVSITPNANSNGRVKHSEKTPDPAVEEWASRRENLRFQRDERRAIGALFLALFPSRGRVLRREVRRCKMDAVRMVRDVHREEIVHLARELLVKPEMTIDQVADCFVKWSEEHPARSSGFVTMVRKLKMAGAT